MELTKALGSLIFNCIKLVGALIFIFIVYFNLASGIIPDVFLLFKMINIIKNKTIILFYISK